MLERAARAALQTVAEEAERTSGRPNRIDPEELENFATHGAAPDRRPTWTGFKPVAQAALLAALDPEDEALVEAVARGIQQANEQNGGAPYDALKLVAGKHAIPQLHESAIGAILAIKRMAQGGS